MILLKDKKIKLNYEKSQNRHYNIEKMCKALQELIEEYENNYNFDYFECPSCHSDKYIFYGHYTRNIGLFGRFFNINIKRVMCKECKHTHALIPQFIIPYFQSETTYLIDIIIERIINNNTINNISIIFNQSRQFISYLIKRFNDHISRLQTTFNDKISDILNMLKDIENRSKYVFINQVRFLQKVPT